MKICFLGGFSGGGTEKAAFAVANELCQKENIDVHILSTGKRGNIFYLKPDIFFNRLSSDSLLGRNKEVYQYIRKNKIDVFITIEALTGVFSILPTKLSGCKHIVWEHANYFQSQGSRYIQKIRQIELCTIDAYVLLTKRDLKNFVNHFRVKTRLEYIYNIAYKQTSNSYDKNSKAIITVGHHRRIKNFTIIPEIARIVFSKHSDWCWKIFGTSDKDEDKILLDKISKYGLENQILLCEWCDEMELEYQRAAMYVMTSLQEGLPMVLLEAKANKLPLISFDIETGPDEIIRDGENGFLVKAYDIDAMAFRIEQLIENDKLRKEFSDNSFLDLENFDKNRIIDKWMNLINTIYS